MTPGKKPLAVREPPVATHDSMQIRTETPGRGWKAPLGFLRRHRYKLYASFNFRISKNNITFESKYFLKLLENLLE